MQLEHLLRPFPDNGCKRDSPPFCSQRRIGFGTTLIKRWVDSRSVVCELHKLRRSLPLPWQSSSCSMAAFPARIPENGLKLHIREPVDFVVVKPDKLVGRMHGPGGVEPILVGLPSGVSPFHTGSKYGCCAIGSPNVLG